METKWKSFKEAVSNPQPEVLATIEYRSHFLSMIGTLVVSLALIFKGYWYVIFALIFQVGVSYSQGMAALQRKRLIMDFQMQDKKTLAQLLADKSFTRKRQRIINAAFGKAAFWLCAFTSAGIAALQYLKAGMSILPFIYFIIAYFITYFIIAYNFAYSKLKKQEQAR